MADKPFNYAEWVAGAGKPQPFEEYQMFACDWVQPGMTHQQGVEACIEGVWAHVHGSADPAAVRKAVLEWGYLGREDE